MVSRWHETLALAAALCLHALMVFVLRETVSDRMTATPSPRAPPPASSFDIEIGEFSTTASSDELGSDDGRAGGQRIASVRHREDASRPESVEPEATELEESEEGSEEVGSAELEGANDDERASRPIDLGLGPDGWKRWVRAPKARERSSEQRPPRVNRFQVFRAPPVSTTGGLQEGLEERDRELGLGPQGRVMSAFHAAAHGPIAPQLGRVRFDVKVLRTGVVEVSVGSASGDVESWRKVAAHVADDLRASLPRIAPPREGVKLVIELVAEETMPNGVKVKSLHGPRIEASPPKLESVERKAERLRSDNPTTKGETAGLPAIDLELPGVYLAERGKVCSYRLGVSVAGPILQGGCDPSNLGASPQRMVRTRVIEQTMF